MHLYKGEKENNGTEKVSIGGKREDKVEKVIKER